MAKALGAKRRCGKRRHETKRDKKIMKHYEIKNGSETLGISLGKTSDSNT